MGFVSAGLGLFLSAGERVVSSRRGTPSIAFAWRRFRSEQIPAVSVFHTSQGARIDALDLTGRADRSSVAFHPARPGQQQRADRLGVADLTTANARHRFVERHDQRFDHLVRFQPLLHELQLVSLV